MRLLSLILVTLTLMSCGDSRKASYNAARPEAPHQELNGVRVAIQRYQQKPGELIVELWIRNSSPHPYSFSPGREPTTGNCELVIDGRRLPASIGANRISGNHSPLAGLHAINRARDMTMGLIPAAANGGTTLFDARFVLKPKLASGREPFEIVLIGLHNGEVLTHTIAVPAGR